MSIYDASEVSKNVHSVLHNNELTYTYTTHDKNEQQQQQNINGCKKNKRSTLVQMSLIMSLGV